MLLVKGSLYSKMKWTDAKDMLHGADREICWTDMLLVKGSSYSKKKGTVAKDMLHGADREICLRRYAISQGLFIFWNEMNGCKRPLYYTERIGKSVWGDMLLVKGSLWLQTSSNVDISQLLDVPERFWQQIRTPGKAGFKI